MRNANHQLEVMHFFLLLFAFTVLVSCGAPAPASALPEQPASQQESHTAIPTAQEFSLIPGEPPAYERGLKDTDSSIKAAEKRAVSGDKFNDNLYERPFTSGEMLYLPDVDIIFTSIASDENFYYFTIQLNDVDPTTGKLTGMYGIELDRSLTGRGDFLVMASLPSDEWSTENVKAFTDRNANVGGYKPTTYETNIVSDGYETQVFFEADKVAYARVTPDDSSSIQIAISRVLIKNPKEFLWGAWADRAIHDPAIFDYNDHFTRGQAGSPIKDNEYYSLSELHSLDNTCRLPYGFEAASGYKGICISMPVNQEDETESPVIPACPPNTIYYCTDEFPIICGCWPIN